jgi:hypothetical protein
LATPVASACAIPATSSVLNDAISSEYTAYSESRATTRQLPPATFTVAVPVTTSCVSSTNAFNASTTGANTSPSYAFSDHSCSIPVLNERSFFVSTRSSRA